MEKYSIVLAIRITGIEVDLNPKSVKARNLEIAFKAEQRLNKLFANNPKAAGKFTVLQIEPTRIHGLTADEFFTDEEKARIDATQSADDFNPDIAEGKI